MRTHFPAALGAIVATHVSAHSFVTNININNELYNGYHPTTPDTDPGTIIGWSTTAFDQGYVNQTGYTTEEIICHRDALNAHAHARVSAGENIHIQWNGWPNSHKGPVVDYLASCGTGTGKTCEDVDKNDLEFFKIGELGLIDGADESTGPGGVWATDLLIANNNSWVVEIPSNIRPGYYVLRTEIISLHNASNVTGAQNYPQCVNLWITGDGTEVYEGVKGKELYSPDEPSVFLDIYAGVLEEYDIPGPKVIGGGNTDVPELSHPVPTEGGPVYTGTETTPVATDGVRATGTVGRGRSRFTSVPRASRR
ncbi:lytic polysaccharide monooxygenase [Poronia punctata]|nr:lytic polysaccharide monooxygenase [Poronia punctata]